MTEGSGLRERKKAATRRALHEAALRLAAEQGPDRVTVEAIADAANVSRRTFSNYFSSKEEALFHGDTARLRRMLDLLHERPADEPPWTALSAAAVHLAADVYDESAMSWLTRRRRLLGHPGLVAHQVAAYTAIERELAGELAGRLGGAGAALRSRVLAAAFLATLRVAVQHWLEHPDGPLVDTLRAALAEAGPGRTVAGGR
ncbi:MULTISPECIES: TetR/AcrR family transcriptional regulator [Micromonospora]|uniref:TetR family transcriptional regulator n=1 Tax=Micromonospora solifontis TaxID=2487138 RepID=A0ABX9W9S1_9ACTN|nr:MULTISPECIES: TetR/AcrR family transcriptional regulator [Micromonospora]NES13183.1 TetR family transcriptional regulator [Micromonospora sp. PPF5-17B]NES39205.1 TetR family transcriptional regulator [Micromonospora solifontis]NES55105.1 TetR family transcriptional regulator [Micromonospora sp. PPF5-6]RNL90144.1 TetR family transcriptional regulator [Micromonospora solifontis]